MVKSRKVNSKKIDCLHMGEEYNFVLEKHITTTKQIKRDTN